MKLKENLENLHLVSASATDIFCVFSGLPMCPAQRNLDLMDILLQRDEGNTPVSQLKRCSSGCCQEQQFSADPAEGSPSPLLDPTLLQLWGIRPSCWSRGTQLPFPLPRGFMEWTGLGEHKETHKRFSCGQLAVRSVRSNLKCHLRGARQASLGWWAALQSQRHGLTFLLAQLCYSCYSCVQDKCQAPEGTQSS